MSTLEDNKLDTTERHSFFESKEHYMQFLANWKAYINEGKHKCGTYETTNGGVAKYDSSLTCEHHLLYNALRKRNLNKSFAPITDSNKLKMAHDDPYQAYCHARHGLSSFVRGWNSDHEWSRDRAHQRFEAFTEPFGDTVTPEMLEEVCGVLDGVKL